ncbi:protein PGR-like [Phalaenopsis equestris]|uniref:Transmembrane protein 19 n=1 Tax=Phalaenopsis equestris TaxID=78828 RepID=A0A1S6YG55_PHAEQ|nr:protein PGR-like [Phalaenopsis equestris]AQX44245.1 hypothetical protein [Phalaenopsis equestris]
MEVLLIRLAVAVLFSSVISFGALRRKSLDLSGALSGFLVMVIHIASSYRFGALLLVFFLTSSKLTKLGEEKKRGVDEEFKEGGQRNWLQVLANSVLATILVLLVAISTGGQDRCLDTNDSTFLTFLIGGIIGHYACCNGDTWSSEIGMLSNAQPRLITTFKKVRKGTNGAVSLEGLLAAAAAGFVIGLTFILVGWLTVPCSAEIAWRELFVIPIATIAGLFGSLIDSLLGATLQFSGYCTLRKKVVGRKTPTVIRISGMELLDNNAVNAVSILITTLLVGLACVCTF